jgi:hypothetical protein
MNWKRMLADVTGSVDKEILARSEPPGRSHCFEMKLGGMRGGET